MRLLQKSKWEMKKGTTDGEKGIKMNKLNNTL